MRKETRERIEGGNATLGKEGREGGKGCTSSLVKLGGEIEIGGDRRTRDAKERNIKGRGWRKGRGELYCLLLCVMLLILNSASPKETKSDVLHDEIEITFEC